MDTPECDVSAIQSGTMEPLPLYAAHDDGQSGLHALMAALYSSPDGETLDAEVLGEFVKIQGSDTSKSSQRNTSIAIHHYPEPPFGQMPNEQMRVRQTIVRGFFDAISKEQDEVIALFINNNLVTANTTMLGGKTPLLAAVSTRNIRIVKELLDFGAEPDVFGIESTESHWDQRYSTVVQRTPLQLAASIGHLPLVKLFMTSYHCDDGKVAPDGQIALRLAAANGHREVVDYLPSRRGGGFLRWQTQHKRAILRIKKALKGIGQFFKFFLWDLEKFFLWTAPKHIIVKPISKSCAWCWKHRKGFGPVVQVSSSAGAYSSAKARQMGVKAVPKALAETSKSVWKFSTETLPKWLKKLGIWLWSLLTKKIPQAIAIIAKWMWAGVSSTAQAIWNVILKVTSLLHTIFAAVFNFFRNLTLKDIWNGLCVVLEAIFVIFPKTLWSWISRFSEASYQVMKTLFGSLGKCIWWVLCGIGFLVVYVPTKIWVILKNLGGSFAKAWYEVLVWFKPKA